MTTQTRKIVLAIACVLLSVTGYAQGPGLPGEPEDTPIDGGVLLMAAAAAGYGVKKLKNKNSIK